MHSDASVALPRPSARHQVVAWLLAVSALPLWTAGAAAQVVPNGAVSPAQADSIRAAYHRPPGRPSFDAVDVLSVPFRVIGFPLHQLVRGIAEGIGLLTLPGPPPFYLRAYRALDAWGLTLTAATSIGPRSSFAGQITFHRYNPFYLQTGISLRGSQRHRAGVLLGSDSGWLDAGYTFQRDAEVSFWGIGTRTPEKQRSDYLRDRQEAGVRGAIRLTPIIALDGGVAFEDNRIDRGFDGSTPDLQEKFAMDLPFGAEERVKFFHFELGTTFDFTRRRGFQTRGVLLRVGGSLFRGTDGTDSDFHRLESDLHTYLPLNRLQTLALRGVVQLNRDDSGDGIPFYHLAALGGTRNARGFTSRRFRDRDLLAVMAEWRYEVWRELQGRSRAELFLFFDEGAVANDLADLRSRDFRASYGFGMRLAFVNRLGALAYIGFSEEETRVGFRTAWPF